MSNIFNNIYVYSYYTLLESTLSIDRIIENAIQTNSKHVILTDKNLYGSIDFYFKAKKHNLNPIIGLDLVYNDCQLLLIAKNNNGYHNLVKIHSKQNLSHTFDLNDFSNDLFIINLSDRKIELKCTVYEKQDFAINLVRNKDDNNILIDVINAIKTEQKLSDINKDESINNFLNFDEAKKIFTDQQIEMNNKLVSQCGWELEKATNRLPKFPTPKNIDTKIYIENLCVQGLCKKLNLKDALPKKYLERLFYELNVIDNMGFNDYFLIVQDFINHAKKNGIFVGPGRGSAAGSLVAYSLNITEVDPIKNNLIFERFLNPERKTLPDIDIDVMDTRRQEVIDYIFDKYGPSNTSYIITFQFIKAKMALRDVGRILEIDVKIIDRISKLLTPELEANLSLCSEHYLLKHFYEQNPELFDLSSILVGVPRQISTHAAGIILSDKSLDEYIPLEVGIDGWQLSQYTMDYLETLGLFKIDILGLKNLSIIREVISLIKETKGILIDLNNMELDDPNVFAQMAKANTVGIFQLESPGMSNTLRKIKPKNIEDVSIVSALFRPGPQAFINDYAKTRDKLLEPKYINEKLKEVLKPTLGFCVYQEQVIEIVKSVANFTTSEADVFRRAISKKDASVFKKMEMKFIDSATQNGMDKNEAKKIYDYLVEFGNYGFNHSHSLAYSYISYWMMYLKNYYPLEFHLVLLRYSDSSNLKNNLYISELKKNSVPIYNVSILKSQVNFTIYNDGVLFGLSNIKGFGNQITSKIINAREQYNFTGWKDSISVIGSTQGIGKKVIETLILCGAYDEFNLDRNFLLLNLDEIIEKGNIAGGDLFPLELSNEYIPMSEKEKSDWEFKLLSFTFSNNKWELYFNNLKDKYKLELIDISSTAKEIITLIRISNLKRTMTKYNKEMAFVEFSSNNCDYSCACFSPEIIMNITPNKYFITKLKISNGKIQLLNVIDSILEE
ncbi:MAG: DNA polymerase III subunit alpha [Mycoplasma sp.]